MFVEVGVVLFENGVIPTLRCQGFSSLSDYKNEMLRVLSTVVNEINCFILEARCNVFFLPPLNFYPPVGIHR